MAARRTGERRVSTNSIMAPAHRHERYYPSLRNALPYAIVQPYPRARGRTHRAPRRPPRPRRVPAALPDGPALVDPPGGRGADVGDRRGSRAGLGRARRRGAVPGRDGRRPRLCWHGALDHRGRTPPSPVRHRHPPRPALHHPDGRPLAEEMHQGVRSWGNSASGETVMLTGAYGMEGEVSRRLLRALPRFVVLTEDEARLAVGPAARRRDRQGLARSGRRARPASGPAPDRGAARVVRAARRPTRPRGTSASPTPSSAPRSGCSSTTRSTAGRSRSWPQRAGCPGRRSPAGSPTWSASRR